MLDNRADPLGLRKFLILRQDSLGSVSKLIELQNFSQLACVSALRSSLTCFRNWLMRVFTAGSLFLEYCLLSLRFSLISAIVSSGMGLLSDRTLWILEWLYLLQCSGFSLVGGDWGGSPYEPYVPPHKNGVPPYKIGKLSPLISIDHGGGDLSDFLS